MKRATSWLKNRRARAVRPDAHPVLLWNEQAILPPAEDFATISMYQRAKGILAQSSLLWVCSPNGSLLHVGIFDSHGTGPGANAARQLAGSLWIDFASEHLHLRNEKQWLPQFIEELNSQLWTIGHGSVTGDFCGFLFERSSRDIQIYLSGYPAPLVRSDMKSDFKKQGGPSGLALGSRESALVNTIKTALLPDTEILLHSREITHGSLLKPLTDVLKLPYPKIGSAELLYFAWLNQGKDRRKKSEKNAQILWISGKKHRPEIDPSTSTDA